MSVERIFYQRGRRRAVMRRRAGAVPGLGFEVFSTGKEKVMESRDVQEELAVMIGMLLFGGGLDSR